MLETIWNIFLTKFQEMFFFLMKICEKKDTDILIFNMTPMWLNPASLL